MPAGEVILVAYSQENLFLTADPLITFFKIVYRRYTNFAIETIRQNFKTSVKFGNKYSLEISKLADLLHKMWLIIELPQINPIYDLNNNIDQRVKFKWAKNIGYAIIDYVEIEIEGRTIVKHWGEFYNSLTELDWNNFNGDDNGTINQYIGNVPELISYTNLSDSVNSYFLKIPLKFWFCQASGQCFPLLNLEFTPIKFNVKLKDFDNCGIISPTNYVSIQNYIGKSILGEPLLQLNSQGYSWGEFDSLSVNTYNEDNFNITSYNLYYRKISDNDFMTDLNLNNVDLLNSLTKFNKFVIYGLYSGSIYLPINANSDDPNSVFLSKKYFVNFTNNLTINNMYLLCDFIYIDNDERVKFYNSKRQYLIEQVYQTSINNLTNLSAQVFLNGTNPCKFIIFMAQVKYFLNQNVNYNFNYNTLFFDIKLINKNLTFFNFINKNVINKLSFTYNTYKNEDQLEMEIYSLLNVFYSYQKGNNPSGFGLKPYSLYNQNIQPSGTINISSLSEIGMNTNFNKIDMNYNKYLFRAYVVTNNYLIFSNGVCGTIFADAY